MGIVFIYTRPARVLLACSSSPYFIFVGCSSLWLPSIHQFSTFFFTFPAHFLPIFGKCAFLCRKLQNFSVVFSTLYKKCDKKVQFFRKTCLTSDAVSDKILGTPTRCSSKGWAAQMSNAKQSRARQFSSLLTFWDAEAELRNSPPDTTFRVEHRRG